MHAHYNLHLQVCSIRHKTNSSPHDLASFPGLFEAGEEKGPNCVYQALPPPPSNVSENEATRDLVLAFGHFRCVQENKECDYWKQDEEVIIHAPRSHTKVYIHVYTCNVQ